MQGKKKANAGKKNTSNDKPKIIKITSQEYKRYDQMLRRMCKKTAKRGSLQVSPEVAERWKNSKSRKNLLQTLIAVQGDKAFMHAHIHNRIL